MSKLRRFTIGYNGQKQRWEMKQDGTDRVRRAAERKSDLTKAGVLRAELGQQGGSVKITTMDQRYQEERTYPRSADPKRSPG